MLHCSNRAGALPATAEGGKGAGRGGPLVPR